MSKKYFRKPWINPKCEIRSSKIHGRGMFAKKAIKENEVVVVWGGVFVDNSQEAKSAKAKGKAVMPLDDDLFIIRDKKGDSTYFINHSCDPNVWMKDAITIIARRQIKAGEELTADYVIWWQPDEKKLAPWQCACRSPLCRRKITGRDWKIPELQKRYKGHFLPLINKWIARQNKTVFSPK